MNIFDSSALLAFAQDEPGGDIVETALTEGGTCGAANWSEVAQKVRQRGASWTLVQGLLFDYPLTVEPVLAADADLAAELWFDAPQLSLGDRLCLAQRARLGAVVWTADTAWGSSEVIRQIR